MNNEIDKEKIERELIKIVQDFGTKWNIYEWDIFEKSNAEEKMPYFAQEENRVAWLKEHTLTNWFNEFSKLLKPLFEQYCTDKKRVYGGPKVKSFGFPSKFNGIENPIECKVDVKSRTRTEVYFKTETKFSDEYLFVLLYKNSQWKIDNYKNRRYGNKRWENQIL